MDASVVRSEATLLRLYLYACTCSSLGIVVVPHPFWQCIKTLESFPLVPAHNEPVGGGLGRGSNNVKSFPPGPILGLGTRYPSRVTRQRPIVSGTDTFRITLLWNESAFGSPTIRKYSAPRLPLRL